MVDFIRRNGYTIFRENRTEEKDYGDRIDDPVPAVRRGVVPLRHAPDRRRVKDGGRQ